MYACAAACPCICVHGCVCRLCALCAHVAFLTCAMKSGSLSRGTVTSFALGSVWNMRKAGLDQGLTSLGASSAASFRHTSRVVEGTVDVSKNILSTAAQPHHARTLARINHSTFTHTHACMQAYTYTHVQRHVRQLPTLPCTRVHNHKHMNSRGSSRDFASSSLPRQHDSGGEEWPSSVRSCPPSRWPLRSSGQHTRHKP